MSIASPFDNYLEWFYLLGSEYDFIRFTQQIEQMEENIILLESTDLRCLIHKQELERLKYLMRSYLRLRLSKIEMYSIHLFKSTDVLSEEERKFLKDYTTATVEALKAISHEMPGMYCKSNKCIVFCIIEPTIIISLLSLKKCLRITSFCT